MIPPNITITEWWFIALVAVAFAYVGARRGLNVELYVLGGVILGLLLADWLAKFLEPWINVVYQLVLAVVREHATTPEAVFNVLLKQPKLITQDIQRLYLGSLVFVLIAMAGFWMGRKRSRKAKPRMTTRVLAAMVGAVNGYLAVYFLFPRHVKALKTVVTVSSVDVRSLLQIQLGLPILITALVLITVGVLGAREGKPKGK